MTRYYVGESIYGQKPPNPKQIDTKGFLTDFCRICHVKWHTESLLDSDIGKGVIFQDGVQDGCRDLRIAISQ